MRHVREMLVAVCVVVLLVATPTFAVDKVKSLAALSCFENDIAKLVGDVWTCSVDDTIDADADPTNELQNLSLSGNTLSLTDNPDVDLSAVVTDATATNTADIQTNTDAICTLAAALGLCAEIELCTALIADACSCDKPGGSCKVFVSSASYTGNLGGLSGADAKCQLLASAAGLGGIYKAWLSDSSVDAKDRLRHASVPYERVDGVRVADNFDDLIGGSIQSPIQVDEQAATGINSLVWTATTDDGSLTPTGNTCLDWTNGTGIYPGLSCDLGRTNQVNDDWTWLGTAPGNSTFRIYCMEQ